MSEAIDLDSDNLCTTEDAFEKFQAVSMYEEDEYITLSDIVSSPPANQGLNRILHDMPNEDVTSLLVLDDNIQTTTVEQNIQENIQETHGRENKPSLDDNNSEFSGSKLPYESVVVTQSEHYTNNVILPDTNRVLNGCAPQSNNSIILDSTLLHDPANSSKQRPYKRKYSNKKNSKEKIVKRKGRLPKPKNVCEPVFLPENDKMKSVTSILDIENDSKETFPGRPQKKVTKRGRKKQNLIEKIQDPTESLTDHTINNEEAVTKKTSLKCKNINNKQKTHKKIRNSISKNKPISMEQQQQNVKIMENQAQLLNKLTEDEIEDMPLVALSNKNSELETNVTMTDLQLPTETESPTLIVQSNQKENTVTKNNNEKKKRGRPKKSDSNIVTVIKTKAKDENENGLLEIERINELQSSYTEDKIVETDTSKNSPGNMDIDKVKENTHIPDSLELVHSENHSKRNSKKPIMSDFEYNIDSIVKNDSQDDNDAHKNSDLSESETNSKRPTRRIVKKNLQYDEGSDEDPYANVELSDDEPHKKKVGRYYSDDEYIPGGKRQISDMSDTDEDVEEKCEFLEDCLKKKRRKHKKSESGSINKSPRKRGKKGDFDNLDVFDEKPTSKDENCDLEDLLETSVIKTNEDVTKPWGTTVEFKNFLAKISQGTDIKIKKTKSFDNTKTPLQIPVLDPVEAKKTVEMCCQTNIIKTKAIAIQTNNVHEVPMKSQVALTSEQSERACEFLSGIVKTTAELGQLMTQKSEDFIEKKINTKYVTDTFKMDYCVQKSFLLFKLAKHNLVQMEEDLAKQYEEFLKENNLIQHREKQKIIEATSRAPSSDSDCEIVEEPVTKKIEVKAAFNPKTVFLNKELSIKIAKKPNEESKSKEKLNIKGKHTVWINDSIMVKKVKPIQSFLAQDSRNKKPPDSYITLEKVRDFFKTYNRQKAVSICAQFVTPEWLDKTQNYTCCYFFDKATDFPENSSISERGNSVTEIAFSELNSECRSDTRSIVKFRNICPESLMILCIKLIQKQMHLEKSIEPKLNTCKLLDMQISNNINKDKVSNKNLEKIELLKTLCLKKIIELMHISNLSDNCVKLEKSIEPKVNTCELQLQISNDINKDEQSNTNILNILNKNFHLVKLELLTTLCFKKIIELMHTSNLGDNSVKEEKSIEPKVNTCKLHLQITNYINKDEQSNKNSLNILNKNFHLVKIEFLKTLCCKKIINFINISNFSENSENLEKSPKLKSDTCKLLDMQISNDINKDKQPNKKIHLAKIELLKTLCFKKIVELIHTSIGSENSVKKKKINNLKENNSVCETSYDNCKLTTKGDLIFKELKPLFLHCLKAIQDIQTIYKNTNLTVNQKVSYEPDMLNSIVFNKVRDLFFKNVLRITHESDCETETENFMEFICDVDTEAKLTLNPHTLMNPISLKSLCFSVVRDLCKGHYEYFDELNIESNTCRNSLNCTINCMNTVSEDIFLKNTEKEISNKKNIDCDDFGKHNTGHINDNNFDGNINCEENTNFQFNDNFEDTSFGHHGNFEDNTHFEETDTYGDHINFEANTNFHHSTNFEGNTNLEDRAHFDENSIFENSANFRENYNFEVNTKFKINTNVEDNNYDEGDDDNNWVSQVQMKELRSFIESASSNEIEQIPEVTNSNVNIKIEPLEVISEQIGSYVKTEPLDLVDDTIITPLDVVAKQENIDTISSSTVPLQRQNSNSYDENTFEAFVSSNKMIMATMASYENDTEEVFTQSSYRVRRQYEPDSDNENDSFVDSLNLLIPQNIEKAKDRLMENSSDEDSNKKKKPDKRRGRPRKATKINNLPPVKENPTTKSELAILTRKMKEKIRQAEKQNESSGSDSDDTFLSLRIEKEKNRDKVPEKQICNDQIPEKEIQCNDVDSTEQILENEIQGNDNFPDKDNVTLPDESDKILLNSNEEQKQCININNQGDNIDDDRSVSPLINVHEPIELLECEPAFPFFDHTVENKPTKSKLKIDFTTPPMSLKKPDPSYIERHGWNCYPIDSTDSKIYQFANVRLDKLPDSFVETYIRYQDLSHEIEDDTEVDKLTNLNSLNRIQPKDNRAKIKVAKNTSMEPIPREDNTQPDNSLSQDIKDEPCEELLPSEEEDANVEDIPSPSTQAPSSESYLAKGYLMNDDSDSEKPDLDGKGGKGKGPKKTVGTSKSKNEEKEKKEENKDKVQADNLMLTADKMMNKELALLHAPVDIKDEIPDIKDTPTKPITRNSTKTASKTQPCRDQPKGDDSSSEEEKQWFTTKEKLLKRLEKKQECPNVDDAKRAKIVSEFIEKRTDGPAMRTRCRPPRRRSIKKLFERRKQMKILTRELLGEDSSYTGKKSSQKYGKGRRNIRKVLDKKSLARSTDKATMEEFQRKQRQIMRQAKLRETLGCEEDVNVVVINEELCLEYDFEQMRPIVSVHSYFTNVMKAHQYEGVKFMWDVCFESVSQVASGHEGGGCILAHCMGLGKTLQVLALLHTVLTHPQLRMQRVLVCCPLSTVLNWVDEIHKWFGPVTRDIKVFELSKLKKTYERAYQLEDWYNGGGIFIIGYELFRNLTTLDPVLDCVKATIVNKIRTALLKPGPDIIICDEGHLLKNDSSVLAVAMSRVTTKRRIVLTGTPMQNNLREYYCMVNFVKPNLLGSYTEYSNRYENPIMNGQHRDSREEDIQLMKARTHILHKVLEGCLQRQEASVLYPFLPKKHEYTVFVSLTKSQRELYTHYLTNYAKETKQSVLKDFHVLQKIWTHPQVLHKFLMKTRDDEKEQKIKVEKEDDLVQEDLGASEDIKPNATETWWLQYVAAGEVLDALHSSNKFLVVFRLLEECIALGDKVLIFSTSLYTMDALEDFLRRINNWSLGREYYRLDGSVPAEVRQKWCREFNAEVNTETKLFLISTRAGSLGLNMTAANRVVILDTSWNPAHDIQSIFRVYRFGQKKDCYIYRLVAMGTMEQKIYERSVTKQAVACRVVDEQQIDRHYNMSELSELYRLDEEGTGVLAGLAAGIRDEALLRVAGSDTSSGPLLYAVHEHDSLLRGSGETALAEDERAAVWHQFQEEHANKHIQNIAMNYTNKNLNLISPNTHENINNQSESTNNQSSAPESKGRPKRGRKSTKVANNTPVQPSTSSLSDLCPIDLNLQEATNKIMNILIQHNFHATNGPNATSDLIKNVGLTVANLQRGTLKNADPMTESIAKIFLEEGRSSLYPVLQASDIETEKPVPLISETEPELSTIESSETIVETAENYKSVLGVIDDTSSESQSSISQNLRNQKRQSFINSKQTFSEEQDSSETIIGTPENYYRVSGVNESETSSESESLIRKYRRNQKREASINSKQTFSEEQDSPGIIVGTTVDYNNICADQSEYQDLLDCEYPQRKRRRQRRDSDEEYVPEKQQNKNIVTDKQKPNTRKSNVKKLVKVTPALHETGESLLKQHLSQSLIKKDKTIESEQVKNENEIENIPETLSESNKETNTKRHRNVPKIDETKINESILLSDDDEIISVTPVQQNIYKNNQKNVTDNKDRMDTEVVDDSVIPLHKSLLTNKNFIKIVAHTYLSGNPMLDEDAAISAAQYSTLKTLNEIDSTGKNITSGPIYDIAVQVLGTDLLKKLHNAGSNKKDSDPPLKSTKVDEPTSSKISKNSERIEDNDLGKSHESDVIEIKKKPGPKGKTLKKVKVIKPFKSAPMTRVKEVIEIPSSSTSVQAELRSMSYNAPDTPEVVPVEMFESPSTMRPSYPISSQEECILPDDDDDDIIIGHSLSPPLISSSNSYTRRNAVSLIVNSVTSNNTKYTTQPKVVQFVEKQSVSDPIPLPPPPIISTVTNDDQSEKPPSPAQFVTINQNPPTILNHSLGAGNTISVQSAILKNPNKNSSTPGSTSDETICLDSDEEDSAPLIKPAKKPTAKALKSTTKLPSVTHHPTNVTPIVNQVTVPVTSQIRLNSILENKTKILLVPASDFAKMEASKNINTQAQAVLKSNKSKTRVLDAATGEPIYVDQTDKNPTSAISQKRPKCQAGDIIRINKGGKIEILRKNEKTLSMSLPKSSLSKLTPSVEEDTVDLQTKARKQGDSVSTQAISSNKVKTVVIEKKKKILNGMESTDRGHTSYSITSDKRLGQSDPMLVLKNVIKIPANKYHTIKVKAVDDATVKKAMPNVPKEMVTKNTNQQSNKLEHLTAPLSKMKNKITPEKDKIKLSTEQSMKNPDTAPETCDLTKNINKEHLSKVIDLTDCFAITNDVGRPVKNAASKNIKMSGSSKDFIINKSGTLICNVPNKQIPVTFHTDPLLKVYPSSSTASQKSIPTSSQKSPINEGKRSFSLSYQNTVPIKKKKTETPKSKMTLEDFNLDDLDDIIELE